MYTKNDYIFGDCSHHTYFSQFVAKETIIYVIDSFGLDRLRTAYNKNKYISTDDVPFMDWDHLYYIAINTEALRKSGESPNACVNPKTKRIKNVTQFTLIAIAKTAAIMAVEMFNDYTIRAQKTVKLREVKTDIDGNPRYVVHFTLFEVGTPPYNMNTQQRYERALKLAKCIGGKAYRGKDFGGGIVFSTYNTEGLRNCIKGIAEENRYSKEK